MLPSFCPNDRVLTFNWLFPKIGDVIIFKNQGKYLIKRIVKIKKSKVYVVGDNRSASVKLTPIKIGDVVGKVILKY